MNSPIIIVSGLPRSGTSLMMQMLEKGGVQVVTDEIRAADTDNPRGYYELEKVKQIKRDASWLPEGRGRAFKMISQLLYDLPPNETYRVIFLERNFAEMLSSQEKMLARLGRPAVPREQMQQSFELHLQRLKAWLTEQPNFGVLFVSYSDLVSNPAAQSLRIGQFLGRDLNGEGMVKAVDPSLYRNRSRSGSS